VEAVSIAFLELIERLAPEARAAFLMRVVFCADYGEVAATLGYSEGACRQLVAHARAHMQQARACVTNPRPRTSSPGGDLEPFPHRTFISQLGHTVNQPRLAWTQIAPKHYQAMAGVSALTAKSELGPQLLELVQTRVSQINGCAFCLDMHARDLRKHGETWQRINSLATWRETGFYSARERAALNWAETLTRLADHHGDHDGAFAQLKEQFADQEMVELTWAIAQINTWNRLAVGMRQPPSDQPLE
jgi:AhpD family alkylhydroperoxidase